MILKVQDSSPNYSESEARISQVQMLHGLQHELQADLGNLMRHCQHEKIHKGKNRELVRCCFMSVLTLALRPGIQRLQDHKVTPARASGSTSSNNSACRKQTQAALCEAEASLVYLASSRTARPT